MKTIDLLMMQKAVVPVLDYGNLYNWFTVDGNSSNFITGLHVPSHTERDTLMSYLGGNLKAGGKIKEAGTEYWNSPNTGATNSSGFSAIGSGKRDAWTGVFSDLKVRGPFWCESSSGLYNAYYFYVLNSAEIFYSTSSAKNHGYSIRCMRDLTAQEQIDFADGDVVEYKTDYDGNEYSVIRIGTQGWTVENLRATHYLDGTALTNITDSTTWTNLSTEAYCTFNNE